MTEQKKLLKAEVLAIRGLQDTINKQYQGLVTSENELKTVQSETAARLGLSVDEFLTARFNDEGVLTWPPKLAAVPSPIEQAIEKVADDLMEEKKTAAASE